MVIPSLQNPIVLAHGFLGFDQLHLGKWTIAHYWPGIPEALTAAGNRVLVTRVAPLGSVAERAAQLKAHIDEAFPDEPVHMIAHSMGGLDARYLISCLGMAERVLSLTTIATPHRGTAFADWGLRWLEPLGSWWQPAFSPLRAIRDVSIRGCRRFNEEVPDAPGVRYFSVAGRFSGTWLAPEWALSAHIIQLEQGENDGLVPVASARYGESCEVWEGDHVSLVNWNGPLGRTRRGWSDRIPQYAQLLERLVDEKIAVG